MADSPLKKAMDDRGIPCKVAYKRTGLQPSTVWQHYKGTRPISATDALVYEKKLGIPRYEIRPDLWTPAMFWFLWADKDPKMLAYMMGQEAKDAGSEQEDLVTEEKQTGAN